MTSRWWVLTVVTAILAGASALSALAAPKPRPKTAAPPASESIFNLTSAWRDQDGRTVSLGSMKGTPLVLAMVYTSCDGACPLTVSDMRAIEAGLEASARSRVRFVLVSFDPRRDTPAKLKEYAAARHLDLTRWTLLTGEEGDVRELAAVLGMQYRPEGSGGFSHSNLISILDADGVLRHQQVGLRQSPADSLLLLGQLVGPRQR